MKIKLLEKETMANVFDVSKYILCSIGGEISSMKLQKLCYYSQAWNLAWDNTALFEEDFRRWDNGPVCRELFDIHQGMFYMNDTIINDSLLSKNGLSSNELLNIDQIMEDYGKYTAVQLSELTHKENPWIKTEKNEIIKKDIIKQYYSSLISENA